MEWISVNDRLPKLDEFVIVATKSVVFSAVRKRFDRKHLWTNAVWGYQPIEQFTGKILYWQPYPELPQKGDNNETTSD